MALSVEQLLEKLTDLNEARSVIEQWANDYDDMPQVFGGETLLSLNGAYKITPKGIGWDLKLTWPPKFPPGYPTFWIEHISSGKCAKFGLSKKLKKPLAQKG